MTGRVLAFVDEYGDTSIEETNAGVTSFFIITAVLIDQGHLDAARSGAIAVRDKYFLGGEIKSSRLGPKKDRRRLTILDKINDLELKHFTFAVNKSSLYKEGGLAHKRTFFKYLNRRLYERLFSVYDEIDVTADEHGSESFMSEFKDYLSRRLSPTLFSRPAFGFADSRSEILLQVADLISGSLARGLDPKRNSDLSSEIYETAKRGSLGITVWPPRYDPSGIDTDVQFTELDAVIRHQALKQARQYLADGSSDIPLDAMGRARVEVLEYLLFSIHYRDAHRFVPTGKLREHILRATGMEISEHQMRAGVIATLRDAGVVIASGPHGYKLPVCRADLHQFASHADAVIRPMLARLSAARETIMLASLGEVDILDAEHHSILRGITDRFSELSRGEE